MLVIIILRTLNFFYKTSIIHQVIELNVIRDFQKKKKTNRSGEFELSLASKYILNTI